MLPRPFKNLIAQFSALPGIGPRMAERLILYISKQPPRFAEDFAHALTELSTLTRCNQCFNIADDTLCVFCRDANRDKTIICVVEEPLDIIPIERTGTFSGLYHVLDLTDNTRVVKNEQSYHSLVSRIKKNHISEVILATNPTTTGDATALSIVGELKSFNITVTQLARGLTTGADIEHADDRTLLSAMTHREELS